MKLLLLFSLIFLCAPIAQASDEQSEEPVKCRTKKVLLKRDGATKRVPVVRLREDLDSSSSEQEDDTPTTTQTVLGKRSLDSIASTSSSIGNSDEYQLSKKYKETLAFLGSEHAQSILGSVMDRDQRETKALEGLIQAATDVDAKNVYLQTLSQKIKNTEHINRALVKLYNNLELSADEKLVLLNAINSYKSQPEKFKPLSVSARSANKPPLVPTQAAIISKALPSASKPAVQQESFSLSDSVQIFQTTDQEVASTSTKSPVYQQPNSVELKELPEQCEDDDISGSESQDDLNEVQVFLRYLRPKSEPLFINKAFNGLQKHLNICISSGKSADVIISGLICAYCNLQSYSDRVIELLRYSVQHRLVTQESYLYGQVSSIITTLYGRASIIIT